MTQKNRFSNFILPLIVILLATFNFINLSDTENIKAIHIVTLITIGMGLGVLLRNIFTYFRRKGGDVDTMA